MKKTILIGLTLVLFSACGNKTETSNETSTNSLPTSTATPVVANDPEGIIGIIDVPEVLTLAYKDSAAQEDIGFKMGKGYGAIEEDMQKLNLDSEGLPAGAIYYSNDPKNFVFECIVPINKIPASQPKNSTVVVLEATRAVVYNYYGPYNNMMGAYEKLKQYLAENKLEQTGPAREFYLSDPTTEKDPAKWLSKIYIPVK